MKSPSSEKIARYYDQTLDHYLRWWDLSQSRALHYGIWHQDTRSFREALVNTNKAMAELAAVTQGMKILDAGCGVGGSSFFLAASYEAKVEGITLSEKQLSKCISFLQQQPNLDNINFQIADFQQTPYESGQFDLIWALESVCHASPKSAFFREASRLLKPGGKLVMADYLELDNLSDDNQRLLKKWRKLWAISSFIKQSDIEEVNDISDLKLIRKKTYTNEIRKSSLRMYRAYLAGALPSRIYNTFNNTSEYAKHHYRSGKYQYLALKNGLWDYNIWVFIKPE